MASQIIATIFIVFVCLATIGRSNASAAPPLCEPGVLEEMPPHIRKVCIALENSNQLSSALNAYIKNEAAALLYKPTDELVPSNFGKRTDVDHVFLRFGRRR